MQQFAGHECWMKWFWLSVACSGKGGMADASILSVETVSGLLVLCIFLLCPCP